MHVFAEKLEKEMCVSIDGWPYIVVDSKRVKYGKGAPFIQVELRDALSGMTRQLQLHPVERLEKKDLVINQVRYLRSDGDCSIFSDAESQEETAISNELLGDDAQHLNKGDTRRALYLDGKLYAVVPLSEIEALL